MSKVSDERLAAMLTAEIPLGMSVADARSILTELQTHRRSPSLSGGEVALSDPLIALGLSWLRGDTGSADPSFLVTAADRIEAALASPAPDIIAAKDAEIAELISRNAVLGSDGIAARKGAANNLARAEAAEQQVRDMIGQVEQAFRDGLAYGSNVEGADPETAWMQSRVRASLGRRALKNQESDRG